MGRLSFPDNGPVYLDANCFIYSIEHIEPYDSLLKPIWLRGGIITSDLTLLEVLVKPLQAGDTELQSLYRELLNAAEVERVALDVAVLEQAAVMRASLGIKTPDAIHAASGILRGCALFLSNDKNFARIPQLPFAYLQDYL